MHTNDKTSLSPFVSIRVHSWLRSSFICLLPEKLRLSQPFLFFLPFLFPLGKRRVNVSQPGLAHLPDDKREEYLHVQLADLAFIRFPFIKSLDYYTEHTGTHPERATKHDGRRLRRLALPLYLF